MPASGPAAKRAAAAKEAAAAAVEKARARPPEACLAQLAHEAYAGAIAEANASVGAASGGNGGLGGAEQGSKAVRHYSSNAASHPFAPAVGTTDGDASDILDDELVEALSPAKLPEQKGISRGDGEALAASPSHVSLVLARDDSASDRCASGLCSCQSCSDAHVRSFVQTYWKKFRTSEPKDASTHSWMRSQQVKYVSWLW